MIDFLELLSQDVGNCLNLIKKIKNSKNKNKLREELNNLIEKSKKELELRKLNLPKNLNFNFDLPVLEKRAEITEIIKNNQIIIISGETGSGKTTQIPKICLSLGLGARGIIGHTQPRRIAAKSTAARIAYELGENLGETVGYQVRFDENLSDKTAIKLMTDGILLTELQEDKFLNKYEVIIIDEAHERSLNIDFLLAYLKNLARKRKDLKIIITSATIDAEKFAKHFNNAPIINVSGRTYPVELLYREPKPDSELANSIVDAIYELDSYERGDILIFLATEREIRETADFLKKAELRNTEILALFGRLSLAEQQKVFYPADKRRIVLSTNVAETSLTVPRIKYVIDAGEARLSRYSVRTKTQRLPIEPISQASANQRAGRCGRLSNGICIRLYSEEDFKNRPEFTEPEILRTNLAAVILQMLVLNLGEISDFPLVDKPELKQINDGYKLLFELGAVKENKTLTEIGRKMAKLPLDPRFSRIIFEAEKNGVLFEAIIVLSALSIQDPRERPFGAEAIADQRQGEFADKNSDFQTLLNLFAAFQEKSRELSNNQLRKWANKYFLNFLRMREWRELVNQLIRECRAEKLKINELKFPKNRLLTEKLAEGSKGSLAFVNPNLEALHQSLMVGFLDMVGLWDEAEKQYQGTRGRKFSIFPASVLSKTKPQAVMAATILETSKTYALNCCPIELHQLEPIAKHLTKSHLENPHWSKKMGNVMAEESILLYGLPIIAGRLKPFFHKDPKQAQEIFINEALITGEINTKIKAISKNIALFEELEDLEDKTRSRGILVNETDLAQFYFARLPESVYSVVSLEQWVKENGEEKLLMTKEDLLAQDTELSIKDYPEFLNIKGHKISLEYLFDPTNKADGITALIPLYALNSLETQDFERLVPALLGEKIEELLRHLPKTWRRQLVPIPDFAKAIYERIVDNKEPLFSTLAKNIEAIKGLKIPLKDLENAEVPPHLMMNYRLLNEKNEILAESRDLSYLQSEFAQKASANFVAKSKSKLADGEIVKDFIWDNLPEKEIMKGGVVGFPALTYENGLLKLKLHDNPLLAKIAHKQGVRKLLEEKLSAKIKYLKKNIPELNKMSLYYRKISADLHLSDDIIAALIKRVCLKNSVPRTKTDFELALKLGEDNLIAEASALSKLLLEILSSYSAIDEALRKIKGAAKEDIKNELNNLIFAGFIKKTPAERLVDIKRYLKAILIRIEKLIQEPLKDMQRMNELALWIEKLDLIKADIEKGRLEKLDYYQNCLYALEEYRVQLFAQNLGTKIKISPEKLKQIFED